jgi:hypothetical protein
MISRKIITAIIAGIFLSTLISNSSFAQMTNTYEAYRPPDAFAVNSKPSPTATPNTQSCNGHCNCNCTDERCNNMPWNYVTSDSSVTVTQCQQNCVTAANEYCASMHPGTATSSTEPDVYATP